jgi:hypothetical protein
MIQAQEETSLHTHSSFSSRHAQNASVFRKLFRSDRPDESGSERLFTFEAEKNPFLLEVCGFNHDATGATGVPQASPGVFTRRLLQ